MILQNFHRKKKELEEESDTEYEKKMNGHSVLELIYTKSPWGAITIFWSEMGKMYLGTIQILRNHWNKWVDSEKGHFWLLSVDREWVGQKKSKNLRNIWMVL
jgi:hypothetical protein